MKMLTDFEADPHVMVASELYQLPPYKVSSKLRKKTKSANFGIIYGMKARALAQSIFGVDSPSDEQIAEAGDLYNLYCYKRCIMLKELEDAKDFVTTHGWLYNKLNYKMVYDQITDVNDFINQVFEHVVDDMVENEHVPVPKIDPEKKRRFLGMLLNACGNYPIQSWAAGILMQVYSLLRSFIIKEGYKDDVFIPLQVHDEVALCYRNKKVHPYQLIKIQNKAMVSKLEYLNKPQVAPLYIGIGFGKNWGQAKGDNEELPVDLQMILIKEWDDKTCPTIEEIVKEGVYGHMLRRIKEYMRDRAITLFKDMMEQKHFVRQEMQHRLNHNMFVGKKISELFGTNDCNGEIMLSEYLRVIYQLGESENCKEIKKKYKKIFKSLSPDVAEEKARIQLENKNRINDLLQDLREQLNVLGVTYEEGEIIQEEGTKVVSEEEIQEFFFVQQVHPLVTVGDDTVTIDTSKIYGPTANKIKNYISALCNPNYDVHNKKVIYKTRDGAKFTNQLLLGIPANFGDVIDKILKGEDINISVSEGNVHVDFTDMPVTVEKEGLVIDVYKCNRISQNALNDICSMVMSYVSSASVARVPILLKGDITKDSGMRMIGVSEQLMEKIKFYVNNVGNVNVSDIN